MNRGFFHTLEALLLLLLLATVLAHWPYHAESIFLDETLLLATCEDALVSMNAAKDFSPETLSFLSESVWPHHQVELWKEGNLHWSNGEKTGSIIVSCESLVFDGLILTRLRLQISGFAP